MAGCGYRSKLNGLPTPEPYFVNTCFSVTAPGWGFSVVHVYRVVDGKLVYATDAGGVSPVEPPAIQRKLEAEYQIGWFRNIMADTFARRVLRTGGLFLMRAEWPLY
jgi:hypothetical protein